MTAEINVFSVFIETLSVMKQTECHLEDCSTAAEKQKQISFVNRNKTQQRKVCQTMTVRRLLIIVITKLMITTMDDEGGGG